MLITVSKLNQEWGEDNFDVEKYIVIQGKNAFGGHNYVLGLLFFLGGIFCVVIILLMVIFQVLKKAKV